MWLKPRAYRHLAVVEQHGSGRPRRGSAIFIHADIAIPTSGCISIGRDRLVRLLRWLRPEKQPIVTIGTARSTALS